jgi:SPP1 family predicted phage head-tail adaptor
MPQNKQQSYNDGIVQICRVNKQTRELIQLEKLRYGERTVGYNRYYKALERDIKIDMLLRCPEIRGLTETDTDILVAIPKDGQKYKIMQIQYPEDVLPPSMDLSLEKTSEFSDLAMASYAQLNCEIDVYSGAEGLNELGEVCYTYSKLKSIWAEITAESGSVKKGEADTETVEVTHKMTIKADDVELSNDMYFIYDGQRFDVKYFMPNYRYKDRINVFCTLVME